MTPREIQCEAVASRLRSLSSTLQIVLSGAAEYRDNGEYIAAAIFLTEEIEREIEQNFGIEGASAEG